MNKSFQYLGYYIEYSTFQKRWFVVDWDYETRRDIGPSHASKQAAMNWCNAQ